MNGPIMQASCKVTSEHFFFFLLYCAEFSHCAFQGNINHQNPKIFSCLGYYCCQFWKEVGLAKQAMKMSCLHIKNGQEITFVIQLLNFHIIIRSNSFRCMRTDTISPLDSIPSSSLMVSRGWSVAGIERVRSEHRNLQPKEKKREKERERGDQVPHLDPIPPGPR